MFEITKTVYLLQSPSGGGKTTLSKKITQEEAVAIENKYKEKLGSRAFGLNNN